MPNARIKPDSFYLNGVPIPASYFQTINDRQQRAINGLSGGLWIPNSPLVLGGAGMGWCGPVLLSGSATITTPLGSGKRIVLGSNDVPRLSPTHTANSRFLVTSCSRSFDTNPSLGSVTLAGDAAVTVALPAGFVMPIRVHDGATFSQAELCISVAGGRTAFPAFFPKMAVFSLDANGNVNPLGGSVQTSGWVSLPTPGSLSAYSGQRVTMVYPIASSTVIDRSRFTYYAAVADEGGSNAIVGNAFGSVGCLFTNIGDLRFS